MGGGVGNRGLHSSATAAVHAVELSRANHDPAAADEHIHADADEFLHAAADELLHTAQQFQHRAVPELLPVDHAQDDAQGRPPQGEAAQGEAEAGRGDPPAPGCGAPVAARSTSGDAGRRDEGSSQGGERDR
jgi:hypothetical protein